jgi:hypothetical protein
MARVNLDTDMLYHPEWNQAKSAKFDHIDPYPSYDTPTDMSLCSAASKYDPSWLTDFTDMGSGNLKAESELLEDLEDLRTLEEMRKGPLKFRKFEEFLEEYESSV